MSTRLLVLDDDRSIGELILRITKLSGFEAKYTDSPNEFFSLIEEWNPTHVAIDLMMPEMDGVEVIERLAEMEVAASIIVTSGLGSRILDAAARSAQQHGLELAGILPKPFKPSDLRSLLAKSTKSSARRMFTNVQEIKSIDIVRGIEEKQFSLVYQPKISCVDESVVGFEALSRWIHPDYGFISPELFIVKAEEFDLIDRLTVQIIENSLAWFSSAFSNSEKKYFLSLNISGISLADSKLIDRLPQYCEKYSVDNDRIILELTETAAMANPIQSLDLLTRLRLKRFELSIDDFGTGYSSMLQLVKLPFSEIKIDKSFVFTALKDEESRAVIKATLELAKSLGLSSTAEGVEDRETFEYLCGLGCDTVQGFYFSKPLVPEDAVKFVEEKKPIKIEVLFGSKEL